MVQKALCDWFQSVPGELLLEQEQVCLEDVLQGLFGYHLVQLGALGCFPAGSQVTPVQNYVIVAHSNVDVKDHRILRIQGHAHSLPVATDSVDAVLLPHTLDFAQDPHQVLREAERILIPEGRIVVVGFNPYSLWGLWWITRRRSRQLPWSAQFMSLRRLKDWFSLLGFDVEFSRELMYRPPLRNAALMNRLGFIERLGRRWWPLHGAVYVVQGVKRISKLTPIQPRWIDRAKVITGGRAVEPSARKSHRV